MKKINKILTIALIMIIATYLQFIPKAEVNAAGPTYPIYVDQENGEEPETYDVTPLTTILELKEAITDRTGIPVERQILSAFGTTLLDDRTIAEYNIQNQATITLSVMWQVTFDTKVAGDDSDISIENVLDGETATEPQTPEKDGYTFGGWYEEGDASGLRFFFANRIREDKNLYAMWLKNIDEIDLTLEVPTVGDTVTITHDDEYDVDEQDKFPTVVSNDPNIEVAWAEWIKGPGDEEADELFSGTFESDKYYYAFIYVNPTNPQTHVLVPDVVDNIKVNGEAPERTFPFIDYTVSMFIAKVKTPTANTPEDDDESEDQNEQQPEEQTPNENTEDDTTDNTDVDTEVDEDEDESTDTDEDENNQDEDSNADIDEETDIDVEDDDEIDDGDIDVDTDAGEDKDEDIDVDVDENEDEDIIDIETDEDAKEIIDYKDSSKTLESDSKLDTISSISDKNVNVDTSKDSNNSVVNNSKSNDNTASNNPSTGDNIVPVFVTLILSCIGVVLTRVYLKKK